jgi:hypothetical protein
MYVIEFIYLPPARKTAEGAKGEVSDARFQEIAVESRDAERIRPLVGEATARTWTKLSDKLKTILLITDI